MNIELSKLTAWSAPKRVETRNGPRNLCTGPATEAFWTLWRSDKAALQAAGISCSRDNRTGMWQACWWQPVDGAATPATTEASTAPVAALDTEAEARLAAIGGKLLAYQAPAVKVLATALSKHGGALDASDTGTGKTYVSLAAALVLGRPVYVVCPKAVIPSWKRAATHYSAKLAGISNYELLRRGTCPEVKLETIKAANGKEVEQFVWSLPANTVIIFDECHRMKDSKTLNCGLGLAALRQGYKVLGLSATAADNPMQMKFASRLTGQIRHEKEFFGWMLKNGVTRGRFGLEFSGSRSVLSNLHHRIFPDHGSRLRIADLGNAFPETQIAAEEYELNGVTSDIQAAYDEMANELADLDEREAADRGACILTARLRARQRTEILKAPAIAALAQDQEEEGMSVAIFVNFDDVLDAIATKLGTKCVVRGGQTAEEREANVAAFQNDKSHFIVCNIKAGGVGISLHGTPASRMRYSIICPSDSSQDMKQALGRVWRANGAKSIQRIFLAANTIEGKVYANALDKIGRIDLLNDGDGSPRPEEQPVAEQPQPKLVTTITVSESAKPEPKQAAEVRPVSAELRALVHAGIRQIAACDQDKAKAINGIGFAKFDVEFGHSLASRAYLSDKMVWAGARMCRKYRKQLGEGFIAQLDELTK